ncbi:MAG: hypothetical protein JF606_26635, partial [Burkholderiales bacterium]|nr:hypothetical protein [Burkholderiales bacterium]
MQGSRVRSGATLMSLGEIYCAGDPAQYAHCLIKPAGQIDLKSVADEKANIDRIVATLGLK